MNLNILPLQTDDIAEILNWNAGKGPDFLTQWAGNGYIHPLTYDQIEKRLSSQDLPGKFQIFKIMLENESGGKIIGTAELNTLGMPKRKAMVCRYLISPAYQNLGYGCLALMLLAKSAFKAHGYKALRLRVFAYNTRAVHCYEKAGFSIVEQDEWDNGLAVYEMELPRKRG